MPAVGDYLQWKDYQTMVGVDGPVMNVFYFEVMTLALPNSLLNMSSLLADWYYGTFLAPSLAMQSNAVLHMYSEVNNLSNYEADFATIVPDEPVAGVYDGDYLSPDDAWSFQLVRSTRVTRNGSKRIAGVPKFLATNNIPTSGARILADDVSLMWEGELTVPLSGGENMTMRMVIPKTPVAPATIPTVFNVVSEVLFRGIGSQGTRKQLRPA